MSGLLGSLQSARSGMSVSQASIQTTSHNINNLNTPGYSRQKVEQKARSAYSYPGYNSELGAGQLGTGVEATDIVRVRNSFYDFQFRNESHTYGKIGVKYDHYSTMETIFNEPSETGISSSISNFFMSWQSLSKNPNDAGSKDIVIQNSDYLAKNISNVYKKLNELSENAKKKLNENIDDINGMLKELKDLDKQIKLVEGSGKSPNDLLDEKDRILDDLSFKMNINDENVQKLIKDKIANGEDITQEDIKNMPNISGEIQGSLEMLSKIDVYKKDLEELAEGIKKSVNDTLGIELFESGTDSILKVKDDILDKTTDLNITSETAQKMYKLKDEKVSIGKDDITINNFYNSIIQRLGNETQEVKRNEKNQSKILKDIDNSRLNVSGVSLDEEMINLIQFQHAYNASAKVVATIDSLLDVVINGLVRR
ncbi:flagellar hook-associated protein FlgK [Paraclostridium ghonii]|uniref:Flagellar hook-associated protein 1 n=1 Tax=Paraclostridium ghonii TaxID=29358 RepID=A0ABU0MW96_9FIRM|nr:flagellar hook-associated protein FlgK [Paeniclostridium ghonii]MDQ0555177.1 flagellar hook-associated protein 1 FlgK [Paeniclostridium ghonii]